MASPSEVLKASFGHPQTCVYPLVCLEIDDAVAGKAPLPGQGSGRNVKYLPCSPFKFLGTKRKGEGYLPDALSR